MNSTLNGKLNAYYKEISDRVLCTGKKRSALLEGLKNDVGEYLESFPEASIEDIISVFGTPEEIAGGVSADISLSEIKNKLNFRRILIIALLTALLIWAIFALISFIDVHTEAHGYFSEFVLHIYNVSGGAL